MPILLLKSTSPLLVDQVEDNLDNAYIYEVLVKQLAQVKMNRQLVVVTHNPNPPTLIGAAQILVLGANDEDGDEGDLDLDRDNDRDSNGEETIGSRLVAAGTFEEVRASVEHTEGGREAFLRRGERYGLLPADGAR